MALSLIFNGRGRSGLAKFLMRVEECCVKVRIVDERNDTGWVILDLDNGLEDIMEGLEMFDGGVLNEGAY